MSGHVTAIKTYLAVFGGLMALTAVTVWVATVDVGMWNTVVALAVAGAKASLVIWFFMEVRHARPVTRMAVAGGIVWLVILLVFLFSDYASRGWLAGGRGW
jgi:cytochrome c oxidase subunit 4